MPQKPVVNVYTIFSAVPTKKSPKRLKAFTSRLKQEAKFCGVADWLNLLDSMQFIKNKRHLSGSNFCTV